MRVSIAENNGSIFHCDFHYFVSGGGGSPLLLFSVGKIMDPASISNPLFSRVRLARSVF